MPNSEDDAAAAAAEAAEEREGDFSPPSLAFDVFNHDAHCELTAGAAAAAAGL